MRLFYGIALAVAISSTAFADAIITFSVTGPNVGKVEKVKTLSDEDAARFLIAYGRIYGQVLEDAKCVPEADKACTMRDRTPAEIVDAMIEGTFAGYMANVASHERELAVKEASDKVRPIVAKEAATEGLRVTASSKAAPKAPVKK